MWNCGFIAVVSEKKKNINKNIRKAAENIFLSDQRTKWQHPKTSIDNLHILFVKNTLARILDIIEKKLNNSIFGHPSFDLSSDYSL